MKIKIFFSSAIVLAMFAPPLKGASHNPDKEKANSGISFSRLITAEEILNYLRGAPHYHPYACCAAPIPGTSNWIATIENCGTATVFVQNGIIIGHQDHNGYCGD